jgi:AraC-like DNA-binding protein
VESERGHSFTCRLGVRNYWLTIRVRDETLGIAYLQALAHGPSREPGRKGSSSTARVCLDRAGATVISQLKFVRAARLLRCFVGQVQIASLNDLRKADLDRAGRVVVALEREQSRLHKTLQHYLPAAPGTPRPWASESRPEQIVHGLLERIEQGFGKPLTLRGLARELCRNAAYLSALFSRLVGVPFKTYLTELRVQKAKTLLGDCAKTSSEVAFAVGYSSEERFRSVFRKATGLSPKAWRETMQATASAPSA